MHFLQIKFLQRMVLIVTDAISSLCWHFATFLFPRSTWCSQIPQTTIFCLNLVSILWGCTLKSSDYRFTEKSQRIPMMVVWRQMLMVVVGFIASLQKNSAIGLIPHGAKHGAAVLADKLKRQQCAGSFGTSCLSCSFHTCLPCPSQSPDTITTRRS